MSLLPRPRVCTRAPPGAKLYSAKLNNNLVADFSPPRQTHLGPSADCITSTSLSSTNLFRHERVDIQLHWLDIRPALHHPQASALPGRPVIPGDRLVCAKQITYEVRAAYAEPLPICREYPEARSGGRMLKRSAEDPLLARLTEIALTFPEATRQIYGSQAQFLVRKKTFAYFLDNHHGDGVVGVTCKVLTGDNKALTEAQPARFYLPAYLASKGWVALRLDVGKVDWGEVKELLVGSYALIAPKRLAEQLT